MLENNTDYDNFGVEEYLLNTGLNKKDINKYSSRKSGYLCAFGENNFIKVAFPNECV